MLEGVPPRLCRTFGHRDSLAVEVVGNIVTLPRDLIGRGATFESRVGELKRGLYLALRVAVDDDEGKVAAVRTAGRRDVEQVEGPEVGDPVRPGGRFGGQVVSLTFHVGVEHDLAHVLGA